MAVAAGPSDRRGVLRMLPTGDGAPSSPRGVLSPQPTLLSSPSTRRRSACSLSFADGDGASPVGTSHCGGAFGACADSVDNSPHHLSVPLTLLSLHNGGHSRHAPRSRDTSPMRAAGAGAGLVQRQGSIGFSDGLTLDLAGAGLTVGGAAAGRASSSGIGGGAGGSGANAARRASAELGESPTPRLVSGALAGSSSPLPARTAGGPGGGAAPASPCHDSTSIWCTPAVTSSATDLPSGAAAAAVDASGLVSPSLLAAAGALSGGGGAGSGLAVSLPAHLCSLRPPTPLTKDEDHLSATHHLASPSRRRSRFASAADPGLLAAAQAAVAAEEAGLLLDSPPKGSYCGSGRGGYMPEGGGLPPNDLPMRRAPNARSGGGGVGSGMASAPGSFTGASGGGGMFGGGSGGSGLFAVPCGGGASGSSSFTAGCGGGLGSAPTSGELPFARPLLGGAVMEAAPWSSSPGRSSSRRAGPSLGTVPEEQLLAHSRGDAFPSRPSALSGIGSGGGGGGSGPGSPAAAAGSPVAGRRQRMMSSQDSEAGFPTSRLSASGSDMAPGGGRRSGCADDSLSSFMARSPHSIGPNSPARVGTPAVGGGTLGR